MASPILLLALVVLLFAKLYLYEWYTAKTSSELPSTITEKQDSYEADGKLKTYTDKKYGYSFKYLANWYLYTPEEISSLGVVTVANYKIDQDTVPEEGTKIDTQVFDLSKKDRQGFIDQRLANYQKSSFIDSPSLDKNNDVSIANLDTQAINLTLKQGRSSAREYIAFPNDFLIIIVTHYNSDKQTEAVKEMLASFVFSN